MSRPRSRAYTFTINNPNVSIKDTLSTLSGKGNVKCAVVGDEKGKSGTRHFQGYVMFNSQVAFNTVRGLLPGAHIEHARGSPRENLAYCSKDGVFESLGVFPNGKQRREDSHQGILRACLRDDLNVSFNSPQYLRNIGNYAKLVADIRNIIWRNERFYKSWTQPLLRWQMSLCRRLFSQNDRKILWIVDVEGNTGKSYVCRYLRYVYGYQLFDGVTATRDICRLLDVASKGYLFDVTRSDSSHFSYSTLEAAKNGYISTGKYEGYIKEFLPKPVLVCSNFHPEKDRLSIDRWDIHIIDGVSTKNYVSPQAQTYFLQTYPPCPPPSYDPEDKEN